ncbi:NAD-dependent epimerase/dehydratase family protein [Candidatus Saccharibacteria bacterium]|nr:NAD-dependent epimerase/dehydratase family protein [Candidatus Saccharibacteria bacterium]
MQVLITGANGFIGKNLQQFLREEPDITIDTFTRSDAPNLLADKINHADFIIHLAGINRPTDPADFKSGNIDLTKTIIDLLVQNHSHTPLIFSSSIQATLDNDYGTSKRLAEDYILNHYPYGIIYRLHNVFGKGCRPNYNSVVATFCDHIAKDKPIIIDNSHKTIKLIYIDDICKSFIKLIKSHSIPSRNQKYHYISPTYTITLGKLADTLYEFKSDLNSILVPATGDDFTKKLFSTFISYHEPNQLIFTPRTNSDERGSFTELIHTIESGQVSVSKTKPGITRGNHYHHTKLEKFIVLQGSATIRMRKISDTSVHSFNVDSTTPQIITIPVGYTHNITNTGSSDLVLLIWCNEIFDQSNPDTFYEEV